MKKLYFIVSILSIICNQKIYSQIEGTNVFMQGEYVEIGMNSCGVFGSDALPSGVGLLGVPYHINTGAGAASPLSGLGFICDSGADGWAEYCGDYFVPGSPVEGWCLQIGSDSYINSDQNCAFNDIPGTITSYSNNPSCDYQQADWTGSVGGLTIVQSVVLGRYDLYFTIYVEICNTDTVDKYNVYYGRNVDPDNDAQQYGDYSTTNTVVSQAYLGDPISIVTAVAATSGCAISLQSNEPNSAVCFGGFATEPADQYWAASSIGGVHSFSGTNTADEAISLGFYWDTIRAGQCVTASTKYVLSDSSTPDSSFNYQDICVGDTAKPFLDTAITSGGVYSFVNDVTNGATIDSVTGYVSNALSGYTYYVLYVSPPPCPPIKFYSSFIVSHCCGCKVGDITDVSFESCVDYPVLGTAGPITVTDNNLSAPFLQSYILTDLSGSVLTIQNSSVFTGLLEGDYCMYTINYNPTDPDLVAGGLIPANYPTLDSLKNSVNTINGVEKPGILCADLFTDCIPIKIGEYKTAGSDASISLCLDDTAQIHLYDLILNEDSDGLWTDISSPSISSGHFHPVTGIVNPVGVPTGIYTFEYMVTGQAPCVADVSQVEIDMHHTPDFVQAGEWEYMIIHGSTTLNGTGAVTYHWEPSTYLSNADTAHPVATPPVTTTFTLQGIDEYGCVDIDTVTIYVQNPDIYVPNAFTPNGDSYNSTLKPIYIGIKELSFFEIYNRWGEKVYETRDMNASWDGIYKSVDQPMGSYTYQIKGVSVLNDVIFKSGSVLIMR